MGDKRILVVDSDPPTLSAMATLLRLDGYDVEPFTSAPEAVAALRSGRAFDAVVADFHLPSFDATALAATGRGSCPNACVVVTHRGPADPRVLHGAGACVVLEKPIQYGTLQEAIAVCREHGGHGGTRCARHLRSVE